MNSNQRAMVDFAAKWAPFGGGDEYLLPEFGLTPPAFYLRLLAILNSLRSPTIADKTASQLRTLCHTKLACAPSRPNR